MVTRLKDGSLFIDGLLLRPDHVGHNVGISGFLFYYMIKGRTGSRKKPPGMGWNREAFMVPIQHLS